MNTILSRLSAIVYMFFDWIVDFFKWVWIDAQ